MLVVSKSLPFVLILIVVLVIREMLIICQNFSIKLRLISPNSLCIESSKTLNEAKEFKIIFDLLKRFNY